jgi:predicted HAD superfamily Cof-like phosphohydrolase
VNINPIKLIYKFNKDAGLLQDGYKDERECAFPIEEALEGFPLIENPKAYSRQIVSDAISADMDISDVDRLDKHLDIIVFSFGSIFKLGLTPQQAMRALEIVMVHNMAKLNMPKDSAGKLTKPDNFKGPEEALQRILDEKRE